MSQAQESSEIIECVSENRELLTRILAFGDEEARGYALALIANGASVADIEAVQDQLDHIKLKIAK